MTAYGLPLSPTLDAWGSACASLVAHTDDCPDCIAKRPCAEYGALWDAQMTAWNAHRATYGRPPIEWLTPEGRR